jgi:TonB family protein
MGENKMKKGRVVQNNIILISIFIVTLFFSCKSTSKNDEKEITPPTIQQNEIMSKIKYPETLLKNKIEGRVILLLYIDKQGIIQKIDVLDSTNEDFTNAALDAFKDIKFLPARDKKGVAINIKIRYPIIFSMNMKDAK